MKHIILSLSLLLATLFVSDAYAKKDSHSGKSSPPVPLLILNKQVHLVTKSFDLYLTPTAVTSDGWQIYGVFRDNVDIGGGGLYGSAIGTIKATGEMNLKLEWASRGTGLLFSPTGAYILTGILGKDMLISNPAITYCDLCR